MDESIVVFDYPEQFNLGDWAVDHPECDAIFEMIGTGPIILVYAYATHSEGNIVLKRYRNEHFADKKILKGMSLDGVRSII